MSFHFASSEYASCFLDLPQPDPEAIRRNTLNYLKTFNADLWYKDPVSRNHDVVVLGPTANNAHH